jgi:Tetratricopeptide repeat
VIELREKVLGPEHPDTLRSCFELAIRLRAQSETQEATAFAQRAAEGPRKAFGPEHPDTKKYEQLRQQLLVKSN